MTMNFVICSIVLDQKIKEVWFFIIEYGFGDNCTTTVPSNESYIVFHNKN